MKENIPTKTKELVVRLYIADVSIDDIVTCTKLSSATIHSIIKEANVEKNGESKKITLSDVINKLDELATQKDIGRNINSVSSPFIRQW